MWTTAGPPAPWLCMGTAEREALWIFFGPTKRGGKRIVGLYMWIYTLVYANGYVLDVRCYSARGIRLLIHIAVMGLGLAREDEFSCGLLNLMTV